MLERIKFSFLDSLDLRDERQPFIQVERPSTTIVVHGTPNKSIRYPREPRIRGCDTYLESREQAADWPTRA